MIVETHNDIISHFLRNPPLGEEDIVVSDENNGIASGVVVFIYLTK
jgi:hypothetical protein